MTLSHLLTYLAKAGCYPGIYRRGKLWRAHVNCAGTYWHEDKTPTKAMEGAIKLWEKSGRRMDGMAANVAEGAIT